MRGHAKNGRPLQMMGHYSAMSANAAWNQEKHADLALGEFKVEKVMFQEM